MLSCQQLLEILGFLDEAIEGTGQMDALAPGYVNVLVLEGAVTNVGRLTRNILNQIGGTTRKLAHAGRNRKLVTKSTKRCSLDRGHKVGGVYLLHGRVVATLEPLSVPATIWVSYALQTIVVPLVAVQQIYLLQLGIRAHIQGFVAGRNLEGSHWLGHGGLNHLDQTRLGLLTVHGRPVPIGAAAA